MANRRNLKKSIQIITSELISETYIAYSLLKKLSDEELKNIIAKIAELNNDFLSRVNHAEPGMTAKAYYRQLRRDFDAKLDEIVALLMKK